MKTNKAKENKKQWVRKGNCKDWKGWREIEKRGRREKDDAHHFEIKRKMIKPLLNERDCPMKEKMKKKYKLQIDFKFKFLVKLLSDLVFIRPKHRNRRLTKNIEETWHGPAALSLLHKFQSQHIFVRQTIRRKIQRSHLSICFTVKRGNNNGNKGLFHCC